ncbi:MAG: AraC family transcriptional regulator [Bacteroidetes bacterium]|nr:AraC family transcriptional regulator [Bacteroidota bacterium]
MDTVFLILIVIQVAGYLISMFFMMKRYMLTIKDTYSSLEKLNLHWLRFIIFSQAVIWPVALMIDIYWQKTSHIGFIWLLISAFIYIIGYIGLLKPEIFSGGFQEVIFSEHSGKKKYEKSTLTQEQAEMILKKLQSFMHSSKPYINPALTLPALSKDLNLSPNYLSQVINEQLGKNFFEFVNSYRVEEAKLLIKNPSKQHLTLAAIGFEAGFNSVSSFNKIFKATTSRTPSQFKLSEYPA